MIFKEFNPNKHDTRKVAELIYSVDYRTNLKVFRSKERAVLAIETLLLSEKNNYNEKKSEDYIIDLNHHNNQKNIANITNDQKYNANNNSIKKTNNHNKSNYNNKYNDRENNKNINNKSVNNKYLDNKDINNKNINSNNLNNNSKFYIILDENDFDDEEDIIGIISLVKGKKGSLLKDILVTLKNLNLLDSLRFSFIYILDYFVLAKTLPDDIYLAEIAIDKSQRGKGMGTEILNIIIEAARKKRFKRVVLDAEFNNKGAIKLYKSLGFEIFDKKSIKLFKKERGMYNMEYVL
nr:GNAT family N-acetyltransferase [Methanobrevibacter arboriphilus]